MSKDSSKKIYEEIKKGFIKGGENVSKLISSLKSQKVQYPILTYEEERQMLWDNRDNRKEIARLLFMHNIRLVFDCCKKYARKTRDFDEMVARSFQGLSEASERFDPEFGTKFSTYAYPWIAKFARQEFQTKEIKKGVTLVSLDAKLDETNHTTFQKESPDFMDIVSLASQDYWSGSSRLSTPLSDIYESEAKEIKENIYSYVKTNPNLSAEEIDVFTRLFQDGQKIKEISFETGLSAFQINKRKDKVIKTVKFMLKQKYGLEEDEMEDFFYVPIH
jgi:RNA polymerase sigma factor (sigma-70 family)